MLNGMFVNLQDIMEHLPLPSLVVLNLCFGDGIRLVKMNVHPFHWNSCRVGYTGFATTAWCACPALSSFSSRLIGMRCKGFFSILKHFYCLHLLLVPWWFWTFTLDGIQLVQVCTFLIQMFAGLGIRDLLLHDALRPCEAFLGWQEWDTWASFVF